MQATTRASFETSFDELYALAYQHAYKLTGDRCDAEDVAQEACARACIRWERLENPAAFVVRVTTNLVFDRFRRVRVAARHRFPPPPNSRPPDERHLDLHRALARLPKRQREVVVLRYLADFSEQQTADALGCAIGSVKAYTARGLHALRESLELDTFVETS